MGWYWIDIAIVAVIFLSVITGLFRGFVKELIALGVWVFAFWFAYHYASLLDPWIGKYVHDNTIRAIVEFVVILFACLILGGVINALIGFLMRQSGLSGTDRVLGMGFGFLRGLFIVAILMVGLQMTNLPVNEYKHESKLYDKFDPIVAWLSSYVPGFINNVKKIDPNALPAVGKAHDS